MLRTVRATRYVTPLREGGSLPGLMEADDLGTYVVKFVGAGQGRKVLVAEIVAGELGRRLGLPVPELVLVEVDPVLGRAEPDQEVQDLLRASGGLNLAMDFLPGSLGFDPLAHSVEADLASRVLWFDAFVGNVDRSWRNPNLLLWHRRLQLIDHGSTLVFHHSWPRADAFASRPYDTADHVLEAMATRRETADSELSCLRRGPPGAAGRQGQVAAVMVFEYAVLRAVPSVERGEYVNIGLSLYCQDASFLQVRVHLDATRLLALDPGADVVGIEAAAQALRRTCQGEGPAGGSTLGQRFRWLTAPRSTVVQSGPVHSGLTTDPAAELERLLSALVR